MFSRRILVASLSVSACSLLSALPAAARIGYPNNLPNGSTFSCLACHNSASGGAAAGWNALGDAIFEENGGTADDALSLPIDASDPAFVFWNAAVCGADSDGDGATNGEELGDPDCEWQRGQTPASSEGITDPSDPEDTPDGAGGGGGGGGAEATGGCSSASSSTSSLFVALLAVAAIRRRR